MGRERRERGLPRLTPKSSRELQSSHSIQIVEPAGGLILSCSLFDCKQVPAKYRTVPPTETQDGKHPANIRAKSIREKLMTMRHLKSADFEAKGRTNQGRTRRTSQCLRPVFRTPDGRCDGFWGASRVETASKLLFDGEDWSSRRVDSFNKNS